jgi:hypothetical protein
MFTITMVPTMNDCAMDRRCQLAAATVIDGAGNTQIPGLIGAREQLSFRGDAIKFRNKNLGLITGGGMIYKNTLAN